MATRVSTPASLPVKSNQSVAVGRWMAVIYNNETSTFDDVIEALQLATDCDLEEAQIETWEAHTYGRAAVHFDSRTTCQGVAAILTSFGIRTEVEPEWKD